MVMMHWCKDALNSPGSLAPADNGERRSGRNRGNLRMNSGHERSEESPRYAIAAASWQRRINKTLLYVMNFFRSRIFLRRLLNCTFSCLLSFGKIHLSTYLDILLHRHLLLSYCCCYGLTINVCSTYVWRRWLLLCTLAVDAARKGTVYNVSKCVIVQTARLTEKFSKDGPTRTYMDLQARRCDLNEITRNPGHTAEEKKNEEKEKITSKRINLSDWQITLSCLSGAQGNAR